MGGMIFAILASFAAEERRVITGRTLAGERKPLAVASPAVPLRSARSGYARRIVDKVPARPDYPEADFARSAAPGATETSSHPHRIDPSLRAREGVVNCLTSPHFFEREKSMPSADTPRKFL